MSRALINANSKRRTSRVNDWGYTIRQEYIQVTRKLLEKSGIKKSKIQTVALRVPKYTEASWAASQRRNSSSVGINLSDFIVVIKK